MGTSFDYMNQAWIVDGRYVSCSHSETISCGCYGRFHEGEQAKPSDAIHPPLGTAHCDESCTTKRIVCNGRRVSDTTNKREAPMNCHTDAKEHSIECCPTCGPDPIADRPCVACGR